MTGEYHVVLLDAGGDVAGWLSPRCRLVNAAWEAGRFTKDEAHDLAGFARRHIRNGLDDCTWRVVAVSEAAAAHYAEVLTQASGGAA
jgi:hypothetical protein